MPPPPRENIEQHALSKESASFRKFKVLHETDWRGVDFVFYNPVTGKYGKDLNEVIDFKCLQFSSEGLQYYLNNGFMMYGLTPLVDIYYTLPNTSLVRNNSGDLQIIDHLDPMIQMIQDESTPEELLQLLNDWFVKFDQEISSSRKQVILPLSGGLDSRMLASFLQNKEYVSAYTYGISLNQKNSYEVKLANIAANKMNLKWKHIKLGKFHNYLDENFLTYSVSTHAHSMYHFEFFAKILDEEIIESKSVVLSGIYADLWAGSWRFPHPIAHSRDLSTLVLHHGMHLSNAEIKVPQIQEFNYYHKNREILNNEKFRILTAARIKVPLIRHLIETPNKFGLEVVSPFLDPKIVACMLNLPREDRQDRSWQKRFIERKFGKAPKYIGNQGNSSDLWGTWKIKLPRLELELLPTNFPNKLQLLKTNNFPILVNSLDIVKARLVEITLLRRLFPPLRKFKSDFNAKYFDFLVLYPIIKLIKVSQLAEE
jgi:asparagine synthetase B (glutamine-hydrolysing)